MDSSDSTSEANPETIIRFSLRTLLSIVILLSAILSFIATPESMRSILYFCYPGIAAGAAGLIYRRPWLIALGCLTVAVSVPLHNRWLTWAHDWHGYVARSVKVTVIDADSHQPIPGVSITLAHDGVERYVTLISNSEGTTTFDWPFYRSGKDFVVCKTGNIYVGWEEFRIEADGYLSHSLKLSDRIGKKLPLDSLIAPFTIALLKSEKPK